MGQLHLRRLLRPSLRVLCVLSRELSDRASSEKLLEAEEHTKD